MKIEAKVYHQPIDERGRLQDAWICLDSVGAAHSVYELLRDHSDATYVAFHTDEGGYDKEDFIREHGQRCDLSILPGHKSSDPDAPDLHQIDEGCGAIGSPW